jgi:prevent-host-death family protein
MTIMTKSLSVAQAKSRLSQLLHEVGERGDRFIIENRGRPVAALVPLTDLPFGERLAGDWVGTLLDLGEDGREWGEILQDIVQQRRRRRPRSVDLPAPGQGPAAKKER